MASKVSRPRKSPGCRSIRSMGSAKHDTTARDKLPTTSAIYTHIFTLYTHSLYTDSHQNLKQHRVTSREENSTAKPAE